MSDPLLKKANFAQMLEELTFNSKEVINKITLFARDNKDIAKDIYELLTAKLREVCNRIVTQKSHLIKTAAAASYFLQNFRLLDSTRFAGDICPFTV